MIYKYNFATKAGCSVYNMFASIQQLSSVLLPSLAPLFANRLCERRPTDVTPLISHTLLLPSVEAIFKLYMRVCANDLN